MWSEAALVEQSRTVTVGGRSITFSPSTYLPRATLRFEGAMWDAQGYCTPRVAAERGVDRGSLTGLLLGPKLARSLVKSETDAQACLVDTDADGRFDQVALVNAGSASDVARIEPVSFRVREMAPIGSQDEVRIRYRGFAVATTSPMLELELVQQGRKRAFDRLSVGNGAQRRTFDHITFVSSKKGWPVAVEILGLTLSVSGVDPATKAMSVEWTKNAAGLRRVVIPDDVKYEFGYR
jgi:hypothetical protein